MIFRNPKRHRIARAIGLALLVSFVLTLTGSSQQNTPGCPEWTQWFQTWPIGSNVVLNTDGLNSTYKTQITNGAAAWNAALGTQGVGIGFVNPPTSSSNGATVKFEIGDVFDDNGQRQVAKITSTTTDANGNLNQVTIRLDPNKKLTNSQGQQVNVLDNPTNILKTVIHELGHTLGLGHHPFDPSKPCGGQTTASVMNTMCTADATNMPTSPTDCDKAGAKESYFPTPSGEGGYCFDEFFACSAHSECCSGFCTNNVCQPDQGGEWDCSAGCTPILLNTGVGGIDLTSVEDGVSFDLNRDGAREQLSWTKFDSTVAFLVLDRNGNGKIDHGGELFGGATAQSPSQDRNGFRALAEYDRPANGGNDNGIIDPGDSIFASLRLWHDLNHDGVSQANELSGLSDRNIASIELAYKLAGRYDHNGNQFRYRAKVNEINPGQTDRWAWDVILANAKRASQRGLVN